MLNQWALLRLSSTWPEGSTHIGKYVEPIRIVLGILIWTRWLLSSSSPGRLLKMMSTPACACLLLFKVAGLVKASKAEAMGAAVMQELGLLGKIWGQVHDWDLVYSKWSGTQFMKISIDEMTATAQGYVASCQKLAKEARSWPVLLYLRVRCSSQLGGAS